MTTKHDHFLNPEFNDEELENTQVKIVKIISSAAHRPIKRSSLINHPLLINIHPEVVGKAIEQLFLSNVIKKITSPKRKEKEDFYDL